MFLWSFAVYSRGRRKSLVKHSACSGRISLKRNPKDSHKDFEYGILGVADFWDENHYPCSRDVPWNVSTFKNHPAIMQRRILQFYPAIMQH
ncbi:MAG TPA: hypothetical protein VK184_22660 [Nostocaceae cyanobacterium]|nr:hypothetical protein [Nostocaceae cyanobacterium]